MCQCSTQRHGLCYEIPSHPLLAALCRAECTGMGSVTARRKKESGMPASPYKKSNCVSMFFFFFLLTILILTLSRHTVWNPGLSLFSHEHPTTIQRSHNVGFLSAPGSLVVRTTAEHISIYAVKAFGSVDFSGQHPFQLLLE